MRIKRMLWMLCGALALCGCASQQGGTSDNYSYTTNYNSSGGAPSSQTFRPGSNPEDIRDPNALTTPKPHPVSPPAPEAQP
jgi:hypothetical protein